MMSERLHPRSSAAAQASTAAVVTAATPYMAAAINALTADRMIEGRSTEGLTLAPSPGLLLLLPLPPGWFRLHRQRLHLHCLHLLLWGEPCAGLGVEDAPCLLHPLMVPPHWGDRP